MEDPILLAMHNHERAWADLLCDDFQDWKQNVAELCAPALKEIALHASIKSVPSPSRVASPLFVEPAIFRPFTDPVAMEPAVERLFAAARTSSPLTMSVAQLMASARNTPQLKEFTKPVVQPTKPVAKLAEPVAKLAEPEAQLTKPEAKLAEPVAKLAEPVAKLAEPVAKLAEPVAQLFAAARAASPLFMEPIPEPVAEVKHTYFATSSTIVPTDPSPFVPQALSGIKTIIARNLPRSITPEELRERFQLYGVVRDVYLPRNKDLNSPHYGTIRGFALIKYDTAAQSDRAIRVLSALGLSIRGKQVTVEFAKSDTAVRT
jgi:hypothetical protein